MSTDVIQIEELHKSYGDLQVLCGLNLRVGRGEVYGLLGPNGSGKSTLIHLMLGFLRPSAGRLRILGSSDLERTRARIGYIPERQRYHTRFTAREFLSFIGRLSRMEPASLRERVDRELALVGLAEDADRALATYSKGMLQRLGVAQALLTDPDLLLIDEPTSGLDPAGQRQVIELLAEVRSRGHTVLLCTHYLQEVELLCDRVGVLAKGRIAVESAVGELRVLGSSVLIRVSPLDLETRRRVESLGRGVRAEAGSVRIERNSPQLQSEVLRTLIDRGVAVIGLEALESPLERLYLATVRGEAAPRAEGLPAWATSPAPPPAEPAPPALAQPRPPLPAEPDGAAPAEGRPGEGDTLLNQLLRRNNGDDEAGAARPEPGEGS